MFQDSFSYGVQNTSCVNPSAFGEVQSRKRKTIIILSSPLTSSWPFNLASLLDQHDMDVRVFRTWASASELGTGECITIPEMEVVLLLHWLKLSKRGRVCSQGRSSLSNDTVPLRRLLQVETYHFEPGRPTRPSEGCCQQHGHLPCVQSWTALSSKSHLLSHLGCHASVDRDAVSYGESVYCGSCSCHDRTAWL